MHKRLLGVAIVMVWFGMIGGQVRREYFQPELARLAEAALSLAPGISFYTLTMGTRTVGQATSRLDTLPDGFELEDLMSLELPAGGVTSSRLRGIFSLPHSLQKEPEDARLGPRWLSLHPRGFLDGYCHGRSRHECCSDHAYDRSRPPRV